MNKRRVLVLNHFAVPRGRAGGTRHVELFERLTGWDYTLVAADRNLFDRQRYEADSPIITVRTVGYKDNEILRVLNWVSYAIGAAIRGLMTPRPDVVYASSPHLLAGVAGWFVAKVRRAKFVLEIRDLWPEMLVAMGRLDEPSLLYQWLCKLERWLYRSADHIVVLAKGSADAIVAHGIPIEKISFLPNGAEPSDFKPPASRDELRERFNLNGTVFVYAGAHGPANGLELLLAAADEVKDSLPEVTLLLVGAGPSKTDLVTESQKKNLFNVRFMDAIAKQDMPALLGAADVGLHVLADVPLFRYGVSPNKLFDYMAAGLPVLTNCPGEVASIVSEAGAGLSTEPRDLGSGIAAMAKASESQFMAWGNAGLAYIGLYRSRAQIAMELERVLEDVLTHPKRDTR
jgi:glycosyltransferase involved in cell wall biosynthesis